MEYLICSMYVVCNNNYYSTTNNNYNTTNNNYSTTANNNNDIDGRDFVRENTSDYYYYLFCLSNHLNVGIPLLLLPPSCFH